MQQVARSSTSGATSTAAEPMAPAGTQPARRAAAATAAERSAPNARRARAGCARALVALWGLCIVPAALMLHALQREAVDVRTGLTAVLGVERAARVPPHVWDAVDGASLRVHGALCEGARHRAARAELTAAHAHAARIEAESAALAATLAASEAALKGARAASADLEARAIAGEERAARALSLIHI